MSDDVVDAGRRPSDPADRGFAAVVCTWENALVPDDVAGLTRSRHLIERLCQLGTEVVVIGDASATDVDDQLRARPAGQGRLHLCVEGGSKVFQVEANGLQLVHSSHSGTALAGALDTAARTTVARLGSLGLDATIVPPAPNRRRIDLTTAALGRPQPAGLPGLAAAVALASEAATAAGLPAARVSGDERHLEIGLAGRADSMEWAIDHLAERGIGSGLLLVVGSAFGSTDGVPGEDAALRAPGTERAAVVSVGSEPFGVPEGVEHCPGGPAMLRSVLASMCRRLVGRVPEIDDDPEWVLRLPVRADRREIDEALGALADGRFGTRAVLEEQEPRAHQAVVCAGVYDGDNSAQHLLEAPTWTALPVAGGDTASDEIRIDLRTGVMVRRRIALTGVFRSMRLMPLHRPGLMLMRAEAHRLATGDPLPPPTGGVSRQGRVNSATWARHGAAPVGGVAVAATQRRRRTDGRVMVERRAAYASDPRRLPSAADAYDRLEHSTSVPFTSLLGAHRAAWARRWATAQIDIPDDPELQLAARFALFHLLASVSSRGEAAVGARGLSGPGYSGHVFWDADVFVLPALAATHPRAARAMLEYRLRRLSAARDYAAASGCRGVRFPWESARDGHDVTPSLGYIGGMPQPIRTGEAAQHIVADVAWATDRYASWSGDRQFLAGPGAALIIETARYWASRVRCDERGRAHLYGVVGPDEYHGPVDDNAYTNVMARWNLTRAADLAGNHPLGVDPVEVDQWRSIAAALVDGYDPLTGRYEQFAGYDGLEPLLVASVGTPPLAADLVLGPERTARSQVIKQPDVLMLHHLVPGEVVEGSLAANLDFYGPRTSHGSSLAPAIHASLLARAGRSEEAVEWLRLAGRLDRDDLTGTTAAGIHLATLGGLWQALAQGFAGLRADGQVLRVDPRLPATWSEMTIRLFFQGSRLRVRVRHDGVVVDADPPLSVGGASGDPVTGSRVSLPPP